MVGLVPRSLASLLAPLLEETAKRRAYLAPQPYPVRSFDQLTERALAMPAGDYHLRRLETGAPEVPLAWRAGEWALSVRLPRQ